MIDYQPLYNLLLDAKADNWVELLPQQINSAFELAKHGTLSHWQSVIEAMPPLVTTQKSLNHTQTFDKSKKVSILLTVRPKIASPASPSF